MLEKSGEFTLQSLEELEGQNCSGHMGATGSSTTKGGNISIYKIYSSGVLDKVSICETKNDLEKVYIHMCSVR